MRDPPNNDNREIQGVWPGGYTCNSNILEEEAGGLGAQGEGEVGKEDLNSHFQLWQLSKRACSKGKKLVKRTEISTIKNGKPKRQESARSQKRGLKTSMNLVNFQVYQKNFILVSGNG